MKCLDQVDFSVNLPPVAGVLSAYPLTGSALVTIFTLEAALFEDTHTPLSYEFSAQNR